MRVVLRPISKPVVNTNPRSVDRGRDVKTPRGAKLTPIPAKEESQIRNTPVRIDNGDVKERVGTEAPKVEEKPAKRTIFGSSTNTQVKTPTVGKPAKVVVPKPTAPKPSVPTAPKPSAPKTAPSKSLKIGG